MPSQPAGVILAAMTRHLEPDIPATGHRSWVLLVAFAVLALARPLPAQDPPPRAPGAPPPVARTVLDTSTRTIPFFSLGTSPLELRGDARPGDVPRRRRSPSDRDGHRGRPAGAVVVADQVASRPRAVVPRSEVHGGDPWSIGRAVGHRAPRRRHHRVRVRAVHGPRARLRAARSARGRDPARGRRDSTARHHRHASRPTSTSPGPPSLGGQYLVWEQNARAFLFSEGKQAINAFFGSPAVTQASDVPAHMLAAAPPQLVLGVGSGTERYTAPRLGEPPGHNVNLHAAYIPIVLAGGADAARLGAGIVPPSDCARRGRAGVESARGSRGFAATHDVLAPLARLAARQAPSSTRR